MWRKAGLILLLAIVVALVGGLLLRRNTTVAEIDRLLRDRVPTGVSYHRVALVLDSLKIERSDYDPAKRDMLAAWRRTFLSLFLERSIHARFRFDQDGNLIGYDLTEHTTST